MNKNIVVIAVLGLCFSNMVLIYPSENVSAGSYNGEDLALAILSNSSWLVDSSYEDTDESGHRQSIVLSSKGTMHPTDGSTFAILSTGIAGTNIITTDEDDPGDERGTWFEGNMYGYPRDEAALTMTLQVPPFMHYIYYDVQFLSSEYPEYVGTQYNDKLTVTVDSPSKGVSNFIFDVNSGYFLIDSRGIGNTGFDIFARSGYPGGVDWVDTQVHNPGADAGASDLIQIGGVTHPVSPNEEITITFNIKDAGDNLFDSAAFIDNIEFTGYAKTEIMGRKTYEDLNGEPAESEDVIKYRVTITNTGDADQDDNPGYEFEDLIPENTTFLIGSETATDGDIDYIAGENKIVWDGDIPAESSVILEFQVTINEDVSNGTIISNQGTIFWDSNEDGTNDETELTDDAYVDDGIDQDGDGSTDDDDPTLITVIEFEYPSSVTETFADDLAGSNATQSYFSRQWFETTNDCVEGTCFEVVGGYHYDTAKGFKAKMRQSGGSHYWNYTFDELDGDMISWESWFACGDGSEDADLFLDFKNLNGQNIARLKFEYVQAGDNPPIDWLIELYYYCPVQGWTRLFSDFEDGYLRNGWYKIRLEKNGTSKIDYSLNRTGIGQVSFSTGQQLAAEFENFAQVDFYSTKNPIVCPMFFWDEHTIGLD